MKDLFSVKNKVFVITGGNRGIGQFIARGLVSNGATCYISARNKESCEKTAEELTKLGPGKCVSLPFDLSKEQECIKLAEEVKKHEPNGIDVLINNAAANWGESLETYPDSSWDKVYSLNVKNVFNLTRAFIPQLSKKATKEDPSRVIMIGSIDGIRIPILENYAYSTSKAALHHLTKVLANKLSDKFICVNCIAPGPFRTKMMAETLKRFEKQIVQGIPLQKIGSMEDIVGVTVFLSSKSSSWITGTIITVDGGILTKSIM